MKSNLDLVKETDLFPYEDEDPQRCQEWKQDIWTLIWKDEEGSYPIGYILNRVYEELTKVPVSIRGDMDVDQQSRTIALFKHLPEEAARTSTASALTAYWRERQTFKLLRKWRNELWPVFGRKGELLFSVERTAMGLFGTMRYGVHLTAYVRDDAAPHGVRLWVPRRAKDKSTFPSMLDNTVAGGLMTGEEPDECIVREADEEASLPEDVVRERKRNVGTITYMYISDAKQVGEGGFIYPECEWVYDLELPADVVPQPKDGEVDEFLLCDVDQVRRDLAAGNFKSNCALVVLDFFDRHGILTEDDEPHLADMRRRMHRDMPFPGPHKEGWAKS